VVAHVVFRDRAGQNANAATAPPSQLPTPMTLNSFWQEWMLRMPKCHSSLENVAIQFPTPDSCPYIGVVKAAAECPVSFLKGVAVLVSASGDVAASKPAAWSEFGNALVYLPVESMYSLRSVQVVEYFLLFIFFYDLILNFYVPLFAMQGAIGFALFSEGSVYIGGAGALHL
jgi:hypothetical protein